MLGGNLGDSPAIFREALAYISQNSSIQIKDTGNIRYSRAVDCVPGTPDFADMAVTLEFSGPATELLAILQETERHFGRPECHRSDESRTLDCDIILFGTQCIAREDLQIPHPRAAGRQFVLEAMNDIAGNWIFPDSGKSVRELWNLLKLQQNQ